MTAFTYFVYFLGAASFAKMVFWAVDKAEGKR